MAHLLYGKHMGKGLGTHGIGQSYSAMLFNQLRGWKLL